MSPLDQTEPPTARPISKPVDNSAAMTWRRHHGDCDDAAARPGADPRRSRREDFTARDLPVAPLLAVEVLSPSTRRIDLTLKRSRYEAAGCASYWVVDPDGPALTAWELRDGEYVEVAHVTGEEQFAASAPYDVIICPSQLLG